MLWEYPFLSFLPHPHLPFDNQLITLPDQMPFWMLTDSAEAMTNPDEPLGQKRGRNLYLYHARQLISIIINIVDVLLLFLLRSLSTT